jgi:hypothetical protein
VVVISLKATPILGEENAQDVPPVEEEGISPGWLVFLVVFGIPSVAALAALILLAAPFEGLIVVAALVLAPAFAVSERRERRRGGR